MYKFEDRGHVKRYYSQEKMDAIARMQGSSYRRYRELWDDPKIMDDVLEKPLEIMLELTSWCNYKCKMCDKAFVPEKDKVNISVENVRNLVKNINEMKVASLWVGAFSECLIHPQINLILDVLKDVDVLDFTLITNGSGLNEKTAQQIIDAGVKRLSVSLDAATKETYYNIRKGNLDQVENHINRFIELRGENIFPSLRVSMVMMDDNVDEREAFLEKWKGKADIIDFQVMMDASHIENLADVTEYTAECVEPFRRLAIRYDGVVLPCCTSYGNYFPLGNIRDSSLKEMWEGEKICKLREEIKTKHFNKVCRNCKR
jgi:radical SAM domain protein